MKIIELSVYALSVTVCTITNLSAQNPSQSLADTTQEKAASRPAKVPFEDYDITWINGQSRQTDFPLQVEAGKVKPQQLRGSIGKGGPTLRLDTASGNVAIRKAR